MHENLRENFVNKFSAARAETLRFFELADESVLRRSPGFGFRPILWHLAHLGTFEEYWLLQQIGGASAVNERFQRIFDPIKTPREDSRDLPTKAEMLGYLNQIRENVWRTLEKFDFADVDPLLSNGYVFDLVHQHELQHLETLAYLFHLLPVEQKNSNLNSDIPHFEQSAIRHPPSAIEIAGGNFTVGASRENEFAYDNEKPAHEIFIPTFRLDKYLTTNHEFAEFIREKGYERPEFWSAAGWQLREKENLQAPLYWQKLGNEWQIRTMFAEKTLEELTDFPVYGISFYEAEAYSNYRGKRLPTEFELEKAASLSAPNLENSNYGWRFGETTPVNRFDRGKFQGNPIANFSDLGGNLWEWTSSDFAAYPGFAAFPYEDYSKAWFDNDHKVLKGGSFVTSPEILRPTFRNFFRRQFRIAFAGIRLATDI